MDTKAPEVIAAQHVFRCRRCRSDLFYDTHVLYHARESSGTTGDHITDLTNRCAFEYFVTPMKWMEVNEVQGKVFFTYSDRQSRLSNFLFRLAVRNAKRSLAISIGRVTNVKESIIDVTLTVA